MQNNRINRKDQQNAGGNWGHPRPFIKRHTDIPDRPEVPKPSGSKKYKTKQPKKPWNMECCPFCGEELQTVVTQEQAHDVWTEKTPRGATIYQRIFWGRGIISLKCKCGARNRQKACPCCKDDSWSKDGVYKHQKLSRCGFVGKKLDRK